MKKPFMNGLLVSIVALALASFAHSPALAQGTTFTFQGSLEDGGSPATGLHDFLFSLFDSPSGGLQLGSTICKDNVDVASGVFTVQLDFGQQYLTTASRYLEISVRHDTGLTCGDLTGFTMMTSRQQLTATPMAMHANSAFALDAADGSPANAVYVDNNGRVGVGTTNPLGPIHVLTTGPYMILQDMAAASQQAGYVTFYNNVGTETAWVGYGSPGSPDFSVYSNRSGGDMLLYAGGARVVTIKPTGRLGIGTSAPAEKLEVRGNIKLGTSGEYYASGGATNMRIIRGRVNSTGTLSVGEGFTVVRASTGVYNITWSPAFPATPVVTGTAEYDASGARIATINGATTIAMTLRITNGSNTAVDDSFDFVAIGIQ